MADPTKPTKREFEEHEITHLPYRSWCWACVRGRGKEAPHRRGREPGGFPELHMNCILIGKIAEPGKTTPCMVVKEVNSKMRTPTMIPTESVD